MADYWVHVRKAVREVLVGMGDNEYAEFAYTDFTGTGNEVLGTTAPLNAYEWYTLSDDKIKEICKPFPNDLWFAGYSAGGSSCKYKVQSGIVLKGTFYVLCTHVRGIAPNVLIRLTSKATLTLQADVTWTDETLHFQALTLGGQVVHSQILSFHHEDGVKMIRDPLEARLKRAGRLSKRACIKFIRTEGTASELRGNVKVWNPSWMGRRIRHRFAKKKSLVQYTLEKYFYRVHH